MRHKPCSSPTGTNLLLQNKFLKIVLNKSRYEKIKDLHTEAKVPSIEEYVGKLQANFNIRLAAQNSE